MHPRRAVSRQRAPWKRTSRHPTVCRAGPIERFRQHLDALYLLALLWTGDDQLAEEAVVDAMVTAADDPSIGDANPASVWRLLASSFRRQSEPRVVRDSPAATVRKAGLSIGQRETLALIAAGRTPDDVATLRDVPPAQVHDDFLTGAWAVNAAIGSAPPKSSIDW